MIDLIKFNENSSIPKYRQIVKSIQSAVDSGRLAQGTLLPSMNEVQNALSVSRETVFKAYSELKMRGIVSSSPGKGFYVSAAPGDNQHHVFLLLDNLTAYKEVLFGAFKEGLGNGAVIDLYFHHFNPRVFKSLIREAAGRYTDYVLMPLEDAEHKTFLEQTLAGERVYILDVGWKRFGEDFPCVCQHFEREVYESLASARDLLAKYGEVVLVWGDSENPYERAIKGEIMDGLDRFCREAGMDWRTVASADLVEPRPGQCLVSSYDFDLVTLVGKIEAAGLALGRDIGILSFNETPLKAIAAGGIATVSTDFEAMGRGMAEMVKGRLDAHVENPFRLIRRRSL